MATWLDTPVPDFPGGDIVHNPQDIFRAYLADTLQKLVEVDRVVAYDAIQPSNMTGMGDLVIVSPRLRLKDIKPKDLVSDLAHRLPRSPPFACPIPDGIHLRVLSSPNTLSRLLLPYVHNQNTSYGYDDSVGLVDGNAPGGPKKKVIVEFSSPNMASEFQVSHLRSTLIGAYVANIHAGKQIGLLAAGWQRFGSEEEFQKAPLQHLLQVNHKIEELFKLEQEECKIAKGEGKDVTEIESRGLYAERDEFFKKMEDKEPEAIALWQRFRDATVEDYKASYGRLGIQFDEYSGESQASPESIEEVETALKEKGVYEEHEGAWTIDYSKHDWWMSAGRTGRVALSPPPSTSPHIPSTKLELSSISFASRQAFEESFSTAEAVEAEARAAPGGCKTTSTRWGRLTSKPKSLLGDQGVAEGVRGKVNGFV
ncbi:hypothetical protein EDB80DRAFT_893135 [Ilyonectria destructans]|nr:hypothetical protein EDB80DRAFT_893135 [Ilyonectria destructans]